MKSIMKTLAVAILAIFSETVIADEVEWTGDAGDGKWSTPSNWKGGALPQNGDTLFNLTGGGATVVDVAFANQNLRIGETAGAFTFGGTGPLSLLAGLTDSSAAAQTFDVPTVLGAADGTFAVYAAGPLATAGKVRTTAKSFVKTGAGTWSTSDGAILGTQDVTVEAGTLRISSRDGLDGRRYFDSFAGTSGNGTLVWRGVRLADVLDVAGFTGGNWITKDFRGLDYTSFHFQNNGTTATVQFQYIDGENTKAVCVTLTQVGDDVYAKATRAAYGAVSAFGRDFSTGYTGTSVATSGTGNGYGVYNLRPVLDTPSGLSTAFAGTSGNGTLVWPNVRLAEVSGVLGTVGGGNMNAAARGSDYTSVRFKNNGTTATVQFQIINNEAKAVCVTLTQVGDDVYAKATRAAYDSKTSAFGSDFSTGHTPATVVTSDADKGYGVYNLRPIVPVNTKKRSITVADGARLDVNQAPTGQNLAESEATHGGVVFVAGDGPDGQGALYNSVSTDQAGATFGRIVLTADASAGGGRMDLRELAGSAVAASAGSAQIEGDYAFTVRNADGFFQMSNVAFGLKRLCVVGRLGLNGTLTGAVAEGVRLASGSTVRLDAPTVAEGIPVAVAENASVQLDVQNAATLNGAFTVGAGATVAASAGADVTFAGAFTNEGAVTQTGAGALVLSGTLAGNGSFTGANVRFGGTASRWAMTANAGGWTSKATFTGANANALAALKAIDITYAGNVSKELEVGPALGLTATTLPLLTVKAEDGNEIASFLTIKDDKLYVTIDLDAVVTATWTGTIDGDITKPGNWACTNALGGAVSDGMPGDGTTVTFTGDKIPSIQTDSEFTAKAVVLSGAALSADCDWSALPATIPVSGKIDLKGHNLTVANLPAAWTAEITDSNATTVYERLEYIESTGAQYIDTDYIHKANTKVECAVDVSSTQPNQWSAIFGARKKDRGSNAFCFFAKCDNTLSKSCYNRSGKETRGGSYPTNVKTTLTCLGKNSAWESEGGTSGGITTDGTDNAGVNTMFVFNLNTADTGGKAADTSGIGMKLYAFKISEADEVKRDFVPAKRLSDGKIGLLDLANFGPNEFYVNRGTGADFKAGEATGEKYGCGGELHLSVASDATVENTSVTLSGSLKLVKEGEGTFVSMDATQTYAGGTDILGGTVKLGGSSYLGPQKSPVTVYEGAVLDLGAGNHRRWTHPVLAGGTLRNSEKDVGSNQEQYSVIALTDNSSIDFTRNGGMIGSGYTATTLDLGGNTLDLKVATGKSFWFDNVDVSAGLLKFSGGGTLAIAQKSLRAAAADFDIASKVTVAVPAEVHDWTVREGATVTVSGSGLVSVYGTFRPLVDTAAKYELKNGATLDIGDKTEAWNSGTLAFADSATITIDVGDRKLRQNDLVVAWEEKPANAKGLTFRVIGTNIVTDSAAQIADEGIIYTANPDEIVTATWTGWAGDGNVANPDNWDCTNAVGRPAQGTLPGAKTTVTFAGEGLPDIAADSKFNARRVVAYDVVLTDDCDWSGLTVPVDGKIDLHGRKLTVSQLAGSVEITDSSETGSGGELHVNVAKDATVENTSVTLSGSLKLVKEGEGTLVTTKGQTNDGGADILGGTIKQFSYPGLVGSPVTVFTGAVFDLGGRDILTHPILAGGTLLSSTKDIPHYQAMNAVIEVTADSFINVPCNTGMVGRGFDPATLDLGGKTLDVTVASGKSFFLVNTDVTAGLFKHSGGGTFWIAPRNDGKVSSLRAAAADFDIASAVSVAVSAEVHDWTVREGATVSGNGTITVNGTYRPDVDTAAKYALKAGTTLDLEGRSTALNAANLTFPEGTVYIDLGTRKAKSGPLISWEEGKGPANVTFKLSPDTVTRGILEVRKDGLYIKYGMLLIFR